LAARRWDGGVHRRPPRYQQRQPAAHLGAGRLRLLGPRRAPPRLPRPPRAPPAGLTMARTALDPRLGVSQGRNTAAADGAPAPPGDYVFLLGDAEPGRFHELASGDHVEVRQEVDLTDADFVRAQRRLRGPASTPPGWRWVASIRVGGV